MFIVTIAPILSGAAWKFAALFGFPLVSIEVR
jgi:hypothetical protein